jgi:hypothetical protein
MPGFTAWYGLFVLGAPTEGETVLVSGAAGAVGSAAGQMASNIVEGKPLWDGVLAAFVTGGVFAGLGAIAGKVLGPVFSRLGARLSGAFDGAGSALSRAFRGFGAWTVVARGSIRATTTPSRRRGRETCSWW